MALNPFKPDLDGDALRVGIVQARFNESVGEAITNACIDELVLLGVEDDSIVRLTVPGALEVPQVLARLGRMGDFDVLIAAGCVIRGETYHFEVVSNESAKGIARVALDTDTPVINAILTVESDEQAVARAADKGRDAARAAVEMGNLMLMLDVFDDDDTNYDSDLDEDEAP